MTLRFGIAGTAYWASEVHAAGLKRAQGATLAGVWGRTPERAAAIAKRYGIRAFPHFEDMLNEVDAVTIAVPPDAQPELGLAAASAGKHLILEKPLSTDPHTAQKIRRATQDHQIAALVFFTRRFVPDIATAIEAAGANSCRQAEIQVHSAALTTASPYKESVWRQATYAALWDIGPHVLSILDPVLGPVERVAATLGPDGLCTLRLEHRQGATADVSVTLRSQPDGVCHQYSFRSPNDEVVNLPNGAIDYPAAFTKAAEALIEMVATGERKHDCDLRLGCRSVDILTAAQESIRTGRAVAVVDR